MKVEWRLFAFGGAFFAVTGGLYWFVSYEEAGSLMLAGSVGALAMVGVWLLLQARKHDPRPEDRGDADPADGAGEVDYFPGPSLWPFVASCGAVLVANAFVFGYWLAVAGGPLLAISVAGYAADAQARHANHDEPSAG